MVYTIKRGSIAASIKVEDDAGAVWDCVYISGNRLPEAHRDGNMRRDVFADLPEPVRAAINRDFGMMFAAGIEGRQALIAASVPYTVEA